MKAISIIFLLMSELSFAGDLTMGPTGQGKLLIDQLGDKFSKITQSSVWKREAREDRLNLKCKEEGTYAIITYRSCEKTIECGFFIALIKENHNLAEFAADDLYPIFSSYHSKLLKDNLTDNIIVESKLDMNVLASVYPTYKNPAHRMTMKLIVEKNRLKQIDIIEIRQGMNAAYCEISP